MEPRITDDTCCPESVQAGGSPASTSVSDRTAAIGAFIIGLPATYRGKPLEEQLSTLNIEWNRIDGVLFRNDSSDSDLIDQVGAKVLLRRELLRSEAGCALAHRQVYRTIVERGDPAALVFEDDARINGSLDSDVLADLLCTSVPTVLQLSYRRDTAITYRHAQHLNSSDFLRAIVPPTTTTAYAVNAAAARLLLDEERPISNVADWPVRSATRIHYYLPRDAIAAPDPATDSTIGDRSVLAPRDELSTPVDRFKRRLSAFTHITWFRYSKYYGSYKSYFMHEFVRMPSYGRAMGIADVGKYWNLPESNRILNMVARQWRK